MTSIDELIPEGLYCYDHNKINCPYWSKNEDYWDGDNGYCSYLERGDWEAPYPYRSGLWNQRKECGVNIGEEK